MEAQLAEKYGEHLVFQAFRSNGMLLLIYVNEETGTFSLATVNPAMPQIACGLDAGEGWLAVATIKGTAL